MNILEFKPKEVDAFSASSFNKVLLYLMKNSEIITSRPYILIYNDAVNSVTEGDEFALNKTKLDKFIYDTFYTLSRLVVMPFALLNEGATSLVPTICGVEVANPTENADKLINKDDEVLKVTEINAYIKFNDESVICSSFYLYSEKPYTDEIFNDYKSRYKTLPKITNIEYGEKKPIASNIYLGKFLDIVIDFQIRNSTCYNIVETDKMYKIYCIIQSKDDNRLLMQSVAVNKEFYKLEFDMEIETE